MKSVHLFFVFILLNGSAAIAQNGSISANNSHKLNVAYNDYGLAGVFKIGLTKMKCLNQHNYTKMTESLSLIPITIFFKSKMPQLL